MRVRERGTERLRVREREFFSKSEWNEGRCIERREIEGGGGDTFFINPPRKALERNRSEVPSCFRLTRPATWRHTGEVSFDTTAESLRCFVLSVDVSRSVAVGCSSSLFMTVENLTM